MALARPAASRPERLPRTVLTLAPDLPVTPGIIDRPLSSTVTGVDESRVSIPTTTGVDATLAIAGPGARSLAFVIDWIVRVAIAMAWYLVATRLVNGTVAVKGAQAQNPTYLLAAVLPAMLIYFLYHLILESALRGVTPGKRLAGVRIAMRSGAAPSIGALLIRNLFRLIDSMPAFYAVGLVCCIFTRENVRLGDLAAGTLLVWRGSEPTAALDTLAAIGTASRLSPSALDLVADLLSRWPSLEAERRAALARGLLARLDPVPTIAPLDALPDQVLHDRLERLLDAGGRTV
jgi:uncharacterized RDD family membrane protein YckC